MTAININSRIGYAKLLKDKTAETALKAIKQFVKVHKVQIITTDNGTEFMNKKAQDFFKDNSIEHYNNEVGDHRTMGKIERFNRTLKQRIMRMKPKKLTQKLLNDLIDNYNDTFHTSIKTKPNDKKGEVIQSELDHNKAAFNDLSNNFNVGESVIYRLNKKTFDKEGKKWSKVVYQIVGIDGFKLHLRSKNNHVLYKSPNDVMLVGDGPTEAKVEKSQVWEVEKILDHKRRSNGKFRYLIKWIGFDESIWESQGNLRLINKNKMSPLEKKYFNNISK